MNTYLGFHTLSRYKYPLHIHNGNGQFIRTCTFPPLFLNILWYSFHISIWGILSCMYVSTCTHACTGGGGALYYMSFILLVGIYTIVKVTQSCPTLCDPMDWLYSPWNSPDQNTAVGCHSLLQRTFPTQGLNPGLPHCRQILYSLCHQGSPFIQYSYKNYLVKEYE